MIDGVTVMLIGSAVVGTLMYIWLQAKMCNNNRF